MEGPQQQRCGYHPLNEENVVEDDFDLNCLRGLNQYLLVNCPAPKSKAKHYNFVTMLNTLLCMILCGCLAIPCIYIAYRTSKSVSKSAVDLMIIFPVTLFLLCLLHTSCWPIKKSSNLKCLGSIMVWYIFIWMEISMLCCACTEVVHGHLGTRCSVCAMWCVVLTLDKYTHMHAHVESGCKVIPYKPCSLSQREVPLLLVKASNHEYPLQWIAEVLP